jgi:lysophospholipase L1-like esterase
VQERLVRLVRLVAKLGAVALVTALLLEAGTRLVAPVDRFTYIPNTYDPVVGIRQIPGARGFVRCPEYSIELRINADGLRDHDYSHAKPAGTRRVLCLGDSFTNGFGVSAPQTFAKILEQDLAAAPPAWPPGADADVPRPPSWEVINAGVAATGTAHQLAWFEHEGYRYAPDIVLLTVSPNDFVDSAASGLFTLAPDGQLTQHPAPRGRTLKILRLTRYLPGYVTLFSRTHFVNAVKERFARRHHARLARASRGGADDETAAAAHRRLTGALVRRLGLACGERGAILIVMLVPALPEDAAARREMAALADTMGVQGWPLIDLEARFAELERRGLLPNYPVDGHWTAEGHAAAAAAIADWLHGAAAVGPGVGRRARPDTAAGR